MDTCIACKNRQFETVVASKDYCVSMEDFTVMKCTNCGFAFTLNAPDADQIGRYYEHEDYISHTDTKEGFFFVIYHKVRSYMLGRKLDYIQAHGQIKRLFDIGSGTGYFVNYVLENGIEVKGFEPDADARTQAKKNFNIDLEASLADVLNRKVTFDAISMWHVLEHVHELDAYFEYFRSLLNENGVLAIAVPNYTSYDADVYGKYWAAYDLPKHLWHFSPTSMKQLAENHHFQHVKSYAMPFDPFYIALLSDGHQKSGVLGKIRAVIIGVISFLKGMVSSEKASSVVYIFTKK
jgi:2-polyprenyl-3-methyl-5-hydroxy-6-metoxy-1,4-benzoquinol methylase